MPTVSVIMPCHNCSQYLELSIRSVLAQSFLDWELIIVDDCSTDNSVKVVEHFISSDPRVVLIKLPKNSGPAVARNEAIDVSKGRFIAFLDSDDLWLPDKLKKQLEFMKVNNYYFSYTTYDMIDMNGHVFGHIGAAVKVCYSDLLKVPSIGCLTAIYDSKFFGKVYMPLIRKRQDLGLWLKLLKKTEYAFGLADTLAMYRVRPDSISANKLNAAQFTWRLYRDVEGLGLLYSGYYFAHYAFSGLLRAKLPRLARILGILK